MVTWDPVEQEGEGDHMEEVGVDLCNLNFSAFGCSKWRMSNGSGKPRKSISRNTKRMAAALLALIWIRHFKALTLTTLQRIRQLKTQKLYMHVDG